MKPEQLEIERLQKEVAKLKAERDILRIDHALGSSLALKLIGESGTDLRAWPSAKHFTSWLACAFGRQAARLDHSVLYLRMPRLFEDLGLTRRDGRFPRLVDKLARVQLRILDH